MDIQKKPTLAEKQAFWTEQLPKFESKYWLPSHFEFLIFDMDQGNYVIKDGLDPSFDDDATEIWHRVNTGWAMWKKAINFTKAQAVPEWISVEDSLPKKNANVLLNVVARRRGKPFSCIGFYSVEPDDEPCFILDDNFTILKGVTHWMQLPQAPKAQEPAND